MGWVMGYISLWLEWDKTNEKPVISDCTDNTEVAELFPYFTGVYRIMFLLMYGGGLRHPECRTLRVKDICFENFEILVRHAIKDQR